MEEEEMMSRILWMERRQEILSKHVSNLQKLLLSQIIDRLEDIGVKPSALNTIFNSFYQKEHRKVVQAYGEDLVGIASKNAIYYQKLTGEDGFEVISERSSKTFFDTFGITTGGDLVSGGYLDSLIKDESIKRQVSEYVYKARAGKLKPADLRKGLETLITDTEKPGIITDFYNQYVIETYQVGDRQLQQAYADQLGFEAFIYAGGIIKTTRSFCNDRNGKVILVSEALAWASESWQGKNAPYNPLMDLGGWNCRHCKNFITNEMAIRRRSDLEIVDGKLRVKGS